MKRLIIAAALACAACNPQSLPSPDTVANRTTLDEKAALGIEAIYRGARMAAEFAVDAGQLKGARAAQVAQLDNALYAAVRAVRRAYEAGNASDYVTSALRAQEAAVAFLAAIRGE